jgi:FADH2 O2-dependent halogenase
MRASVDVAVLGAGMGGSLTALVLKRLGLRVVLVDSGHHPRFAIGESSTPTADFVLRDLADRYDLPRLRPLAAYGSWQATHPELTCGRKRGFSYFHHHPGKSFRPEPNHANELFVAASPDDEHSDTHWLRADVDRFLASEAEREGVELFEDTEVQELQPKRPGWGIACRRRGESFSLAARFLVDATGAAGLLARALELPDETHRLHTRSRALYTHLTRVRPFETLLASTGAELGEYPFSCDRSAQHHLLDGAWMWNLRFENGTVSVGLVLDLKRHPLDVGHSPEEDRIEWTRWLERYPSLAEQLDGARIVDPPGRICGGRLQRLVGRVSGSDWVLLPHTAGFVDPLHSSGIAHTLCGIERLSRVFEEHWNRPGLEEGLRDYEATVRREVHLIDLLVHGGYRTLEHFPSFVAYSMLYFAAATSWEQRRAAEGSRFRGAFLCADDERLFGTVEAMHRLVQSTDRDEALEQRIATAIRPYNHVGLCDPEARNLYRYTVAAK